MVRMREDIAGEFALESVVETQSTPSKRLIDMYLYVTTPLIKSSLVCVTDFPVAYQPCRCALAVWP